MALLRLTAANGALLDIFDQTAGSAAIKLFMASATIQEEKATISLNDLLYSPPSPPPPFYSGICDGKQTEGTSEDAECFNAVLKYFADKDNTDSGLTGGTFNTNGNVGRHTGDRRTLSETGDTGRKPIANAIVTYSGDTTKFMEFEEKICTLSALVSTSQERSELLAKEVIIAMTLRRLLRNSTMVKLLIRTSSMQRSIF